MLVVSLRCLALSLPYAWMEGLNSLIPLPGLFLLIIGIIYLENFP